MFSAWCSWGSLLGTGPVHKSVGQGQSHTQGLRPQANLPAGYIGVAPASLPRPLVLTSGTFEQKLPGNRASAEPAIND